MKLQIMGQMVENGEELSGEMIKKIGLLIMDKNTDPFELHIASVDIITSKEGCASKNLTFFSEL